MSPGAQPKFCITIFPEKKNRNMAEKPWGNLIHFAVEASFNLASYKTQLAKKQNAVVDDRINYALTIQDKYRNTTLNLSYSPTPRYRR